jgi:hypothetical protein
MSENQTSVNPGLVEQFVKCPYCLNMAVLVDSIEVYRRSYGLIWLCRRCDAYVGTHKNSPTHAPLGRLANAELRMWKMRAHAAFDYTWQSGKMTRKQAYAKMAEVLNMTKAEAHIGKFNVDECRRLVDVFSR